MHGHMNVTRCQALTSAQIKSADGCCSNISFANSKKDLSVDTGTIELYFKYELHRAQQWC